MSSREWFDPEQREFKFFWSWKLPSDHLLASFQNKIVFLGKHISDLNMDDSEIALLSALNIANPCENIEVFKKIASYLLL